MRIRTLSRSMAVAAASAAVLMAAVPSASAAVARPATTAHQSQALVADGPNWALYAGTSAHVKPVTFKGVPSAHAIADGLGVNCGIITCTLYIYRGTTRSIDNQVARYANASAAAIAAAFAVACAELGPWAVVCAGIGAIAGGYAIDQFNFASNHHECIAIKFTGWPPSSVIPLGLNPDNSRYCHN